MNKSKIAIFIVLMNLFASCKKNLRNIDVNNGTNSFSELKVSPNFSWKTNRLVQLKIEPFSVYRNDIKTNLSIKTKLQEKTALHQSTIILGQQKELMLSVPSNISKLYISVGSITKEVEIVGSKVVINLFK